MTEDDFNYVGKLLSAGFIHDPVLELGAGYGGLTSRQCIESKGITYRTTDIVAGAGVDYIADFESEQFKAQFGGEEFGSILILNVLEHVFAPIDVLDNAVAITRKGGTIVVITPCMWPVHNYPNDHQRLLPDWYVSYAERRPNVHLLDSCFEFLGFGPVASFMRNGERHLPPPTQSTFGSVYSRCVHKIFNTSGRGQWTAKHVAIGAVFEKR